MNEMEDMRAFADQLWKYFGPKLEDRLTRQIGFFRAEVDQNLGDGRLAVKQPLDATVMVLPCTDVMSDARPGDQVIALVLGSMSNAVIVADGRMNICDGGGGGGGDESMFYYDLENTGQVVIGDGEEKLVLAADIVTLKNTHLDFHGEIKGTVDTTENYDGDTDTYTEHDGMLYVTYKLGGMDFGAYHPEDTLFDGVHLLHLLRVWRATGGLSLHFEVWIRADGCSYTVETGEARGYIAGIGIAGDSGFDGKIEVNEPFPMFDFDSLRLPMADSAETVFPQVRSAAADDGFPMWDFFGRLALAMEDGVSTYDLHRISAYYDPETEAMNVTDTGTVWVNTNPAIDGTVTSPVWNVTTVLYARTSRTSNSGDVTYLVSFAGGESWYTWSETWVPYEGTGYGMAKGTLEAITQQEWAPMLTEGTVTVRAILQGDAELESISIYTAAREE